jgi:hypothetical protein
MIALEREWKETQEACREAECVAEDRENRLVQLEHTLANTTSRLSASERECETMKSKYDFQVEVSQRVARHYHTLQQSTFVFNSHCSNLEASLTESQHLFSQTEQRIQSLHALQVKVSETMAKRREILESREKSLRFMENANSDLQTKLNAMQLENRNLTAQFDTTKASLSDVTNQLQVQIKENVQLGELTKRQCLIIDKDHQTTRELKEEIENRLNIHDSQSKDVSDNGKVDVDVFDLRSQISILETRVEELSQTKADLISNHKRLVDSLILQRDEANETATKLEKRVEELEHENADIRGLIAKRSTAKASSSLYPSYSAIRASPNHNVSTFGSPTAAPPSNSAPRPQTQFPSNLAKINASANSLSHTNPDSLSDSVMEVDAFDDDPLRPFSPMPSPSHGLNLLGDLNSELFQYKGLKCCREPAAGLTVTCSRCQEMFHVSCVESVRNKTVPKNKRFLCYICDPMTKSPRPRKPRLNLQE